MTGTNPFASDTISNIAVNVGSGGPAFPSSLVAYNAADARAYIQFFNSSAAGAVVGTPFWWIGLDAGASLALDKLPKFPKGLSIAATTGHDNATALSSAIEVSMVY